MTDDMNLSLSSFIRQKRKLNNDLFIFTSFRIFLFVNRIFKFDLERFLFYYEIDDENRY
jgi:hypothetical protein